MRGAGVLVLGGEIAAFDNPDPADPGPGEVVIAVRAAGVGNWDELARTGAWDLGLNPPAFIGVEAAGVIVQAGAGVRNLAHGDEVMGHMLPIHGQGAWASLVAAPAEALARKPTGIDWNVAAAFSVPALTAEQALVDALALQAGECLLVHGAAGVTGGLIVQRAAGKGVSVIATGNPASAGRLRTYGAETVLDRHDRRWPAQAREAAGAGGITACVNAVRGEARVALQAVAPAGRLATITGDPPSAERGISVSDVYVRPDGARLAVLADALAEGALSIVVAGSYPFEAAGDAFRLVVEGRARGAVVVVPEVAAQPS